MKVLLCLLSGQHVPNLLSVHHYLPDRLVLIETPKMRQQKTAAHFLRALELGGLDYRERYDIEPLEAYESLDGARAAYRRAFGRYSTDTWIANVTGGLKPMGIAGYEFFKAVSGDVVYTSESRPNVLISLLTGQEATCSHSPSIDEFLAGYGYEVGQSEAAQLKRKRRAEEQADCARLIAQHASPQSLLSFSSEEDRIAARARGLEVSPGQLRLPSSEAVASAGVTFGLRSGGGLDSLSGKLDKYGGEFFTGGWLEVFFYDILARHAQDLGVWDVRTGLDVRRCGDITGNEFDVVFMRDNVLCIVECKSGSQEQDSEGSALYKIEAGIRQFRALRVRSFLATTGSNVLDKSGAIKPQLKTRAEIYDCRILLAKDIIDMATANDASVVRARFFEKTQTGE